MLRNSLLFVNEYGIYPELIQALQAADYDVTVEHLMRKAISFIKKKTPDCVVAEFVHEGQFRDRVSNLESMLAQIEKSNRQSRVIVLYEADREAYLQRVLEVFEVDLCLVQPVAGEQLVQAVSTVISR